jgi:hypothetical protein
MPSNYEGDPDEEVDQTLTQRRSVVIWIVMWIVSIFK